MHGKFWLRYHWLPTLAALTITLGCRCATEPADSLTENIGRQVQIPASQQPVALRWQLETGT